MEISRQLCESHDPTKRAGKDLAKRWVSLFHDTRKQFQAEAADIAIANRAFRLRVLGRMAEEAEQSRNYARAAALLEQAAKEAGDVYANRGIKCGGRGAVQIPPSVEVEFTHRHA